MTIEKFPAIILQSYETSETSEVIRTFSAPYGRLSIMAKGVRNPKSRLAGWLQPLSTVEVSIFLRNGAEMGTLRDAAPINERRGMREDLERLALGCVLAEIAAESCGIAQESTDMFNVLERGLEALDPRAPQPPPTAAAHHLMRILALAGYEPHLDPALLAPWPEDTPKPALFWMDIEEGRIHARGTLEIKPPRWPMPAAPNAEEIALPPQAVRAVYSNQQTETEDLTTLPSLDWAYATQLIDGLICLAQYHLHHPVRSGRFWRSLGLGAS